MILAIERKKMIKNIWIKVEVEVEGEIERRGDSTYKVFQGRKERILYLESYFQLFFKNNNLIK